MTDEEKAQVASKLARTKLVEHWDRLGAPPKCPMCQHETWRFSGVVDLLSRHVPGRSIPAVVVICERCAFVANYAAVPIGAVAE